MHKKEAVTFTNMCLLTRGDRVLVQDRRDPAWPGVTFPGGHVEEGDVWWVPLADLPKLPLARDMEDMLRVFLEEDLSEFYYRIEDGTWIRELK